VGGGCFGLGGGGWGGLGGLGCVLGVKGGEKLRQGWSLASTTRDANLGGTREGVPPALFRRYHLKKLSGGKTIQENF